MVFLAVLVVRGLSYGVVFGALVSCAVRHDLEWGGVAIIWAAVADLFTRLLRLVAE
jgi:hypothetical protein